MKLFACIIALLLSIAQAAAAPVLAAPPPTVLQILGAARPEAARLSDSVLVIVDAQREYVDGKLRLSGIEDSLAEGAKLLARARTAGTPIVHVAHQGGGALFDPQDVYVEIATALAPRDGESIIRKHLPNAFAGTNLAEVLSKTGRKRLLVIGYMTHMCVSSTVRAALELGYQTTVVAAATATRDLPDGHGGTLSASTVQAASLAALADLFATIVFDTSDVQD